jgi:ABC-2 type transport system ATP-binding protein
MDSLASSSVGDVGVREVEAPVVDVRGLTKSYGVVHAIWQVNLRVARGECVALLGPNGAGKTTLMETLAGYRRGDTGRVTVLGQDPARAGGRWRERIGVVAQRSEPIPGLKVWEAVAHWAGFFRASRDPAETLSTVGLEHKVNEPVSSLSGGLRRRLEFALAIIGRPELLLLDEPTAGMDPVGRRSAWDLFQGLKQAGVTILLATHFLEEAAELADRLVVIRAGRVVAVDTPAGLGGELRSCPVVRWTQAGGVRQVRSADPAATVRELTHGGVTALADLEIYRPTLEEAYVTLIRESAGHDVPESSVRSSLRRSR